MSRAALALALALLVLMAAPTEAQRTPLKTDGCTLAPEFDFGDCCHAHDAIYWKGGTEAERLRDGLAEIPIEERAPDEVSRIRGRGPDGTVVGVELLPEGSHAANYAFDVTPARLVTALITERGVCEASAQGLLGLYPERAA